MPIPNWFKIGLDQSQDDIKRKEQQDLFDKLRAANPKARIHVGDVSIEPHEADKQGDLLRWLQMMNLQDERLNKHVVKIGERVQKEDIPQNIDALKTLKTDLPGEGQKFKSFGGPLGVKNLVPDWAVPYVERAGILPQGANAERQAFRGAQTLVRKPLYGTQVPSHEMQAFQQAYGMSPGGSEEDLMKTLQRVSDITRGSIKNIQSSTPQKAWDKFQADGGVNPEQVPTFYSGNPKSPTQPSQEDAERARLQQLRAKHRPRQ